MKKFVFLGLIALVLLSGCTIGGKETEPFDSSKSENEMYNQHGELSKQLSEIAEGMTVNALPKCEVEADNEIRILYAKFNDLKLQINTKTIEMSQRLVDGDISRTEQDILEIKQLHEQAQTIFDEFYSTIKHYRETCKSLDELLSFNYDIIKASDLFSESEIISMDYEKWFINSDYEFIGEELTLYVELDEVNFWIGQINIAKDKLIEARELADQDFSKFDLEPADNRLLEQIEGGIQKAEYNLQNLQGLKSDLEVKKE